MDKTYLSCASFMSVSVAPMESTKKSIISAANA